MPYISALARTLNVSTQSLYKKINKSMKNELSPYITTKNGQKFIDEQGAELIKNSLQQFATINNAKEETVANRNSVTENNDSDIENGIVGNEFTTVGNKFATIDNEIIKLLQQNISVLQQQLEIKDRQIDTKDKQIEELTTTVKLQAESISTDRKNELAETIIDGKDKLIEGTINQDSKKGFFNFFKNKKK